MTAAEKRYEEWLKETEGFADLQEELTALRGNAAEISDRFFKELAFGTGGLRGKLGAGTNRMNVCTVGRATHGLADYLLSGTNRSAVIAYDTRHMSEEFAALAARILAAKGIKVYLFDREMPTPVLSFAVRQLQAGAGIVITASHNPKEYNGYKVYNAKGCQITDEAAAEITDCIEKHGYFEEPGEGGTVLTIGTEMLEKFLDAVQAYALPCNGAFYPSVVYTPLNGTGLRPVTGIFGRIGLRDLTVVPSQRDPDGNFSTCPYPNPEEESAMEAALKLAAERGAELVIATDPDADRIGVAARGRDGIYRRFSGNEVGVLLEDFIFSSIRVPENAYFVKTIVTTPMAEKIASAYGVKTKNVLTGFKYIGETIDASRGEKYLFGMEESCGYLIGEHVRDKDSISAAMAIVQMAAHHKERGKTLPEALEELYGRFGKYRTSLHSRAFEGENGRRKIRSIMASLRACPPEELCGERVLLCKDYLAGEDGLPKSDVLLFSGGHVTVIVRPSGTEPKIKAYVTACGGTDAEAEERLSSADAFAAGVLA